MTWTCAVCSYENIPARTRCEICDGPRPAASKSAVVPSSAIPAAPSKPAVAPKPATVSAADPIAFRSEDDVKFLTQFGFSLEQARQALKEKKNRDDALEWLLSSGTTPTAAIHPPKEPEPVKSKSTTSSNSSTAQSKQAASAKSGASATSTPQSTPKLESTKPVEAPKKKKDPKVEKEQQQQALERAKERERLAEVERARLAELRLSAVSNEVEEKREKPVLILSREEQVRQEAILSDMKKEREAEKLAEVEAQEAKRKRKEQESAFRDIPAALASIEQNYDPGRFQLVCITLSKIINKILSESANTKFQSLNLSSEALQAPIVRTVGALAILQQLGFKQVSEDRWTLEKPNAEILRSSLKLFTSAPAERFASSIPQLLDEIDEKKAPLETVYFVVLELRDTFRNCINLPTNLEATSIDTETLNFRRRIKRIPRALQILEEYGFKKPERPGDVFWKCTVDIPHLTSGVIELNKLAQKLAPLTPIAQGLRELRQHNKPKVVADLVASVQECLKKIVSHPEEEKYRRFKLDKLWKKIAGENGTIRGGNQFLTFFGFVVKEHGEIVTNDEGFEEIVDTDTGNGVAFMPSPKHYDPELIKLRLDDLARCWAEKV